MENKNFFIRLISLVLIVVTVFFYNIMTENKQLRMMSEEISVKMDNLSAQLQVLSEKLEELEKSETLEELEEAASEEEQEVIKAESAEEESESKNYIYKDGKFEGKGQGFGGEIQVEITIKEDVLESVEILDASGEDAAYINLAKGVIDHVLNEQSTEVDTISGATFSSTGILIAIEDALGKAEK